MTGRRRCGRGPVPGRLDPGLLQRPSAEAPRRGAALQWLRCAIHRKPCTDRQNE